MTISCVIINMAEGATAADDQPALEPQQDSKKTELATSFPAGLRVLLVDDDPVCLMVVGQMLRACQYEVSTCQAATSALDQLRDKSHNFDLVLSDVYMPDMDGFKLLEIVGLELGLPVIMMSANDEHSTVMRGVTHGACDFLIKPVRLEELKNIWQHVVRRSKHNAAIVRDAESDDAPGDQDADSRKRNVHSRDGSCGEQAAREEEGNASKKPRVVWSVEMHQQFVQAVNQLGIDKAVPKKILDLMKVDGLTRENVASHLQKYRLYLKRVQQNAPHRHGSNSGSAAAAAAAGGSSFSAAMGLPSMLTPGGHNQMMWDGSKQQLMDVMAVQQHAAAASVQQAAAVQQQHQPQQHPPQQQQQHPGQQQQQQMGAMAADGGMGNMLGMMPGGGLMSPMGQVMPGLNMGMGAMPGLPGMGPMSGMGAAAAAAGGMMGIPNMSGFNSAMMGLMPGMAGLPGAMGAMPGAMNPLGQMACLRPGMPGAPADPSAMMAMMTANMQAMFQAQQAAAAAAAMPTSSGGGSSGAAVVPQQGQQQQQPQQQLPAAAGGSMQGQRSSSTGIPAIPAQNMLSGMGSGVLKMDPGAGLGGLSAGGMPASLAPGMAQGPAAVAGGAGLQQQHAGSGVVGAAAGLQQQQHHAASTAGMAAHDFSNVFSDVFGASGMQVVPPSGQNTHQGGGAGVDDFLNLF